MSSLQSRRNAESPPVCRHVCCLPWLPWHLWPVSLGWRWWRERAGWGPGWLYHKSVLQIKKAEMDRKTLDWEIVELTNKLLDAKNTINKLEELNVCAHPRCGSICTLGRAGL